jgi:membrane-associated phospholipid phosphatase
MGKLVGEVGGAGLAYGKAATPTDSVWPRDGSMLDELDKRCSAPIFRLQIGRMLEWCLSVPGCFFGMPAVNAVCPAVIACGLGGCSDAHIGALGILALLITAIMVVWISYHADQTGKRSHLVLFRVSTTVAALFVGTALVAAIATKGSAQRAGYFQLAAWYAQVMPILYLKDNTKRRRPVACEPHHIGSDVVAAAAAKALNKIPMSLRRLDPNTAFPSGDVGGAMTVAYTLWNCGGSRAAALACVVLSAFGRMYWQAHHLLDVLVGACTSLLTCAALDMLLHAAMPDEGDSSTCPPAAWWHPGVVLVALWVEQQILQAAKRRGSKRT